MVSSGRCCLVAGSSCRRRFAVRAESALRRSGVRGGMGVRGGGGDRRTSHRTPETTRAGSTRCRRFGVHAPRRPLSREPRQNATTREGARSHGLPVAGSLRLPPASCPQRVRRPERTARPNQITLCLVVPVGGTALFSSRADASLAARASFRLRSSSMGTPCSASL